MPARPDLAELERLHAKWEGAASPSVEYDAWFAVAAAAINALPFLLAEARKVANAEYERDMHVAEGVREMKRADALVAQVETLREALRRLASQEGFEGAGMVAGDSLAERELRARGWFAQDVLAGLEGERDE